MQLSATRLSAGGPSGGLSLMQRAMAALRRNGGSAWWVPDDYAGTFTDSTGATPVSTVGNVLGLITDRSYGVSNLGPERTINGDFASGATGWTVNSGWAISGASVNAVAASGSLINGNAPLTANRSYLVEFDVTYTSGTLVCRVGVGAAATFASSGRKSCVLTTINAAGVEFYGGAFTGSIDNISVREVLGNHATQPTTASKPVIALNAQGRKVISFDGSNDFLQTGITTGNEGWMCAGVNSASYATTKTLCWSGGNSPVEIGATLRVLGGGAIQMVTSDGVSQSAVGAPSLTSIGVAAVIDGGWTTVKLIAAINGSEAIGANTRGGASTQKMNIGNTAGGQPFSGQATAFIYCPVLPSAADRATIRRWVGSLQGQQL